MSMTCLLLEPPSHGLLTPGLPCFPGALLILNWPHSQFLIPQRLSLGTHLISLPTPSDGNTLLTIYYYITPRSLPSGSSCPFFMSPYCHTCPAPDLNTGPHSFRDTPWICRSRKLLLQLSAKLLGAEGVKGITFGSLCSSTFLSCLQPTR